MPITSPLGPKLSLKNRIRTPLSSCPVQYIPPCPSQVHPGNLDTLHDLEIRTPNMTGQDIKSPYNEVWFLTGGRLLSYKVSWFQRQALKVSWLLKHGVLATIITKEVQTPHMHPALNSLSDKHHTWLPSCLPLINRPLMGSSSEVPHIAPTAGALMPCIKHTPPFDVLQITSRTVTCSDIMWCHYSSPPLNCKMLLTVTSYDIT